MFREPEEQSQGCHSFGKNACMERCCHGLLASVTQPRLEADSGGNMSFMIPFVDCPKKTSTHGPSLGLSLQWASWSRCAAPHCKASADLSQFQGVQEQGMRHGVNLSQEFRIFWWEVNLSLPPGHSFLHPLSEEVLPTSNPLIQAL